MKEAQQPPFVAVALQKSGSTGGNLNCWKAAKLASARPKATPVQLVFLSCVTDIRYGGRERRGTQRNRPNSFGLGEATMRAIKAAVDKGLWAAAAFL